MSELYDRLGYLLKHAQIGLSEHTGPALARLRVDGRELAVLTVLSEAADAGGSREGPAGGRRAADGVDPHGGQRRTGDDGVDPHGGQRRTGDDGVDAHGGQRRTGDDGATGAGPHPTAALAQHEAAERLGVDRTTMVELIDALEGKGLVRRTPDPADRRRKLVHLTDQGRAAVAEGGRAARQAERAFLAALTPAEADQLRALLRRAIGVPARTDSGISA